MRPLVMGLVIVLLIISVALNGYAVLSRAQEVAPPLKTTPPAERTIVVTGIAERKVTPDFALLRLGVQAREETPGDASRIAASGSEAIMTALAQLGVSESDIRSTGLSLYYSTPPGQPAQYTATSNYAVTVRDTSRISAVLDAALKAGANTFTGMTLHVSQEKEIREELLGEAIRNARSKAGQIAQTLEVQIKETVAVAESGAQLNVPTTFGRGGGPAGPQAPPITPGESTIMVWVTASFSY